MRQLLSRSRFCELLPLAQPPQRKFHAALGRAERLVLAANVGTKPLTR